VITNDVTDYINLLVRIAHIICNHTTRHHIVGRNHNRKIATKSLNNKILKKTIILPVVLYGCETSYLTLGVEHTLRVIENRVLRRIFIPKREEVTGGWRRLDNEELHDLCCSQKFIGLVK
jgi:hypothetical protein